VLWRRPISSRFGDMGSLMVATPERFYLKDGTGVLILNPKTGAHLARIEVTQEPRNVRWLAVSEGVLLTLAGPKPFNPMTDIPAGIDSTKLDEVYAAWQDASEGQELVAWDAQRGKELWRFTETRIALDKLAVSGGRVFLYVNASDAVALDLRSGRQLWKSPAPQPDVRPRFGIGLNAQAIMNQNRGEPHALASPAAYVIFAPLHLQYQAFDATNGHELWKTPMDPKTRWAPGSPLILGDKLFGGGINLLTGEKTDECKNPLTKGGFPSAGCGHSTAVESGLWVGYGVIDMKTGRQTAPNMAKAPCGTGFFVADGMEVLYPNTF